MTWPALRRFLEVPDALTGRGVRIALVDGEFTAHPDIAASPLRTTYQVRLAQEQPQPAPLPPSWEPWPDGAHGLWAAAAAAGSGAASGGRYQGLAPEAELYLIKAYVPGANQTAQQAQANALRWLAEHWRAYNIRGVQASIKGEHDSGLLPWQTDPLRVLCERLASEGLLVVSGTGNHQDATCWVTQAAAPSALAVGGVIIPAEGTAERAAPYHGCRGTSFEGKWVPEVLAPAENVVLPWVPGAYLDAHCSSGSDALPHGYARTEGSSFAGPIVLGAAACVWQKHPHWSAGQVQDALKRTCRQVPQWGALRAGLVDVQAAAALSEPWANAGPSPYAQYQRWRARSVRERLAVARSAGDAEAVAALLSFLPEGVDSVVADVRTLLVPPAPRMRAALLCVLAARPEQVDARDVLPALSDVDPYVRMAALYALRRCQQLWAAGGPHLAVLLADRNSDIAYAASELAGEMKQPALIAPLVRGLEQDVQQNATYVWGARVRALEAMTAVHFPEEPEWRLGECPATAQRRAARAGVARRWRAWLVDHQS